MDARIDVFAVLGLHVGEAIVVRNAGARITEDVLRSLALAVHALGVDEVVVMQHTKCGLTGVTDEELQELTGAEVGFLTIHDHAERARARPRRPLGHGLPGRPPARDRLGLRRGHRPGRESRPPRPLSPGSLGALRL